MIVAPKGFSYYRHLSDCYTDILPYLSVDFYLYFRISMFRAKFFFCQEKWKDSGRLIRAVSLIYIFKYSVFPFPVVAARKLFERQEWWISSLVIFSLKRLNNNNGRLDKCNLILFHESLARFYISVSGGCKSLLLEIVKLFNEMNDKSVSQFFFLLFL